MGIIFALLFCSVQITTIIGDKITLPVFLVDVDNAMKDVEASPNPFFKLSTVNFADIIHDSLKNSRCVIIFAEEYLSTEDVSARNKQGSPYLYLGTALKTKRAKYFPAVTQPYRVMTHILQPQPFNILRLNYRTKLQLTNLITKQRYLYVFFEDGHNGTRVDVLRMHDKMMSELYFAIRKVKSGPIVAFYTGKANPVRMVLPEYVPPKPVQLPRETSVMITSNGALFRFMGVFAATATRRSEFNQMPMVAKETRSNTRLATKITYSEFELEFHFRFEPEGWEIDSVALLEGGEEVGRTRMAISAPWGWSYECGEPIVIVNSRDNSLVAISQYQIQPRIRRSKLYGDTLVPLDDNEGGDQDSDGDKEDGDGGAGGGGNSSDSDTCFSTAINCGPYFNTNILSGFMVAVLCLAIAGWGVLMLSDCNSNDRYEDPHGKPLTPPEIH